MFTGMVSWAVRDKYLQLLLMPWSCQMYAQPVSCDCCMQLICSDQPSARNLLVISHCLLLSKIHHSTHQISQVGLRMVKSGKHVARHRWCRPLWNPSPSWLRFYWPHLELRQHFLFYSQHFLRQKTIQSLSPIWKPSSIHLHRTVYLSKIAGKFASFLCKILIYRQTRTVAAARDVAQEACTVSGLPAVP